MNFDYLLSETEPYLGIKPNIGGDISMIVDEKQRIVTVSGEHVLPWLYLKIPRIRGRGAAAL